MASSKRASKTSTSPHQLRLLHERFYRVLDLGTRCYDHRKMRWECKNIETQRHMLRSIAAFLDSVSRETTNDPLVKDSLPDMVGAVEGILQQKNEITVSIAADMVVKLVNCSTTYSILKNYVLELVHPLSILSVDHQPKLATSSARALNLLISNPPKKKEKEMWEIFNETKIVAHLMSNIIEVSGRNNQTEYCREMTSLLGTMSRHWPQARYPVWSNSELMKVLGLMSVNLGPSLKVAVLKLCSALALCGYGAAKIMENEDIISMMVTCMETSVPQTLKIEAFKLAQCLMMNEPDCSQMINSYGEPIVKAIVHAMSAWRLQDGKVLDQIPLLLEACQLAMITKWEGQHHTLFWKMDVCKVLFDLLLPNLAGTQPPSGQFSVVMYVSVAREGLNATAFSSLRPYIWDILGYLAMQCAVDFEPSKSGDKFHIDILITCASVALEDALRKGQQLYLDDVTSTSKSEAAARTVLMMVYSPCKYISSKSRTILFELLKPNSSNYLECLMRTLVSGSSTNTLGMPYLVQVVIHLIVLTCLLVLPQYGNIIATDGAVQSLLGLVRRCLIGSYSFKRSTYAFHLRSTLIEKTCCRTFPDGWEGRDVCLFHCLWALTEIMHHCHPSDVSAIWKKHSEVDLISCLQDICSDPSLGGARWFAACVLTYYGLYGFPSKFGKIIGKARDDNESADIQLNLVDDEPLRAHGVLLMVRCPSLLPLPPETRRSDDYSPDKIKKLQKDITLSSRVRRQELEKLLDYVYVGYLFTEKEDSVKKLKTLSQGCRLQPLTQMLCRRLPKWGTPFPTFNLTPALTWDAQRLFLSDIILEAKECKDQSWSCNVCSSSSSSTSAPHIHAHRIVVCASCSHLQAMLQSGMLESRSGTLKVAVSWEALVKLVEWLYSNELPKPASCSGCCLWENMRSEERVKQLKPYIELSWLAEMWFLEEIQAECSRMIISCIMDDGDSEEGGLMSARILEIAREYGQWEVAEAAGNRVAASYRQLHECGALESLDEQLVDMLRAASVRLSFTTTS